MSIVSHLRHLFNPETCQSYIHTLRWKDRPLQCPRCQSLNGLCRKMAFSRQNPKIVYRKTNDLRDQTFLFSVMCDRTLMLPGNTTTHENRIYKAALFFTYPLGGSTSMR